MNADALRGPSQHARNASIAAEERALANYSHKSPVDDLEQLEPSRIGGWLARINDGLLPASDLTNHSAPVL